MPLELYVFPPSPRSFKVLAAATYLELDFQKHMVDFGRGEQRTPEYRAINPNGKAPVLKDGQFVLFESNAILQHLASMRPEKALMPADPERRAKVVQWQFWDLGHWERAWVPLLFERFVKPFFGMGEEDPAEIQRGLKELAIVGRILDDCLAGNRFVAGPQVTVADFSLGAVVSMAGPIRVRLDDYPNILRWHDELTKLSGWRESLALPSAA
ncbi:MAG TPA: glutathione S-transferase family protein [Woeseiaceae bacterium]